MIYSLWFNFDNGSRFFCDGIPEHILTDIKTAMSHRAAIYTINTPRIGKGTVIALDKVTSIEIVEDKNNEPGQS